MARAKIAITLDEATLGRVDRLVRESFFASRSRVRDIEVTIPVLVFIVARVLVYMIH